MAEVAGPSTELTPENSPEMQTTDDVDEPKVKKMKTESSRVVTAYNLQEKLSGILCCTVCLDLPNCVVNQCTNGHLMCAGCFAHLLADARLKDETATCPNCRCEISKTVCSRNLAVEKAISELPAQCRYCSTQLPRSAVRHHERELCPDRYVHTCVLARSRAGVSAQRQVKVTQAREGGFQAGWAARVPGHRRTVTWTVPCKYMRIGCGWRGAHRSREQHEAECAQPQKQAGEVLESLEEMDRAGRRETAMFSDIFRLLGLEKIQFTDIQLRPYRTDDFLPKLLYESARFNAFNMQWVVKARVNDHNKKPECSAQRVLSHQVVLKSKTQTPLQMTFLILKGPYAEGSFRPQIFDYEFSNDSTESSWREFLMDDETDTNKLLAQKLISFRLILFQVSKS